MARRSSRAPAAQKRAPAAQKTGRGVRPTRGRPPVHTEPWAKVSVVLFRRQVELLDALRARLRRDHDVQVSRAGAIRVAIDLMQMSVSARVPPRILSALAREGDGGSRE